MSQTSSVLTLILTTPTPTPTTTSSTVQAASPATTFQFQFDENSEMETCGIFVFKWTYSGPSAFMTFVITNKNVPQSAPLANRSSNDNLRLDAYAKTPNQNGYPLTTRLHTPTDLTRRQYSPYLGYDGTYLPLIEEELGNRMDPHAQTWQWPSVYVPQGWYEIRAAIHDVSQTNETSPPIFVRNGTSVDCVQQFATVTTSKSKSHAGAIAGGTVGGIAALILAFGILAFIWRRHRQHRVPKSALPSFSDALIGSELETGPTQLIPTSTNATYSHVETSTGPQIFGQSFSPGPPFQSPPRAVYTDSIPVGLSSKELARLRSGSKIPITQQIPDRSSSSSFPWQSLYPPTATTDLDEAIPLAMPPFEARRLELEVESLRREVQQLRAQQPHALPHAQRPDAPPSYGNGSTIKSTISDL